MVESVFEYLFKQGLGYVLFLGTLLLLLKTVSLLLSEKDKRVDDSKQSVSAVAEPLKQIQQTLDLILRSGGNKND